MPGCCHDSLIPNNIETIISLPVIDMKTKGAICATCPHQHELKICSKNGKPLPAIVQGFIECPLNKHPDKFGRTKWKGFTWKGLAYPLRIKIASPRFRRKLTKYGLKKNPEPLPYCGCSIWAKGNWVWLVSWLHPCPFRSQIREFPTKIMNNFLSWMYSQYPKQGK